MEPVSVLLVDDNPTFLRIAIRLLEGHEDVCVVGAVRHYDEALRHARRLEPDVVLVGISMPQSPGLDTIPILRRALPDTGIIALMLIGSDGSRRRVMDAGADEFIPKATVGAELLPAIRRLIHTTRAKER